MMSGSILTDRPLLVPGLDYQDAVLISRMARYAQRLDKQVNIHTGLLWWWSYVALELNNQHQWSE